MKIVIGQYTAVLVRELERTLDRIQEYQKQPGSVNGSATHAALYRASLDLSRALSAWRKAKPQTTTDDGVAWVK